MRTVIENILKLDAKRLRDAIAVLTAPNKKTQIEQVRATLGTPLIDVTSLSEEEKPAAREENIKIAKANTTEQNKFDDDMFKSLSLDTVPAILRNLTSHYQHMQTNARELKNIPANKFGIDDWMSVFYPICATIFKKNDQKTVDLLMKISLLNELCDAAQMVGPTKVTLQNFDATGNALINPPKPSTHQKTQSVLAIPKAKTPQHQKVKSAVDLEKERVKKEKEEKMAVEDPKIAEIIIGLTKARDAKPIHEFQSGINEAMLAHGKRANTEQTNSAFNKVLIDFFSDRIRDPYKNKDSILRFLDSFKHQQVIKENPKVLLQQIYLASPEKSELRTMLSQLAVKSSQAQEKQYSETEINSTLQSLAPSHPAPTQSKETQESDVKQFLAVEFTKLVSNQSNTRDILKSTIGVSSTASTLMQLAGDNHKAQNILKTAVIDMTQAQTLREELYRQLDPALKNPANEKYRIEISEIKKNIANESDAELLKDREFYRKVVSDVTHSNQSELAVAATTQTTLSPTPNPTTPTLNKSSSE